MNITIHKSRLLIYILVVMLGLVFASFYGGPVSFAFLYAILLLIPVSGLYIFVNSVSLRIFQEVEVHKLTKGEEHRFSAIIENEGFLPIHRMRLYLYEGRCDLYEIENGQEISLGIHERRGLDSGISCRFAGAYCVGIEKVSFDDPFCIFTFEKEIPYSFRAVVRPQITDIARKALDLENLHNSTGLKSALLYEDSPGSDLRAYQRGDSLSSINWKVSARLSELMVRVPDRMEKRSVTILMQASNVPERLQDTEFLKKRDFFLEFVVSAAWSFGQQKVPVRLIYPAGKVSQFTVDSYDSFMDFYNIVADSIFYRSEQDLEEMEKMVADIRSRAYDNDTWILVREDYQPSESNFLICG